jgi:hypothetical protein
MLFPNVAMVAANGGFRRLSYSAVHATVCCLMVVMMMMVQVFRMFVYGVLVQYIFVQYSTVLYSTCTVCMDFEEGRKRVEI